MSFASRLIAWYRIHGRHGLPWLGQDAYHVWLSEIMLQQTQVATVVPYYQRFIGTFPDIVALAAASEEQVLACWSGLGYYARGRNLHRAAQIMVARHEGKFPRGFEHILALPGIGRSTAAAICALAFHERHAILDGNVKRVLARHGGIDGWAGNRQTEIRLWQQADALLPEREVATYTQALMDLGATVCTRHRARCEACPVRDDCIARQTGRTAELPEARPRKPLPERHVFFLFLVHGQDVLLEKRPSQGIWGGLWCFPQLDEEAAVGEWLVCNGIGNHVWEKLEPIHHSLTHFRMSITPMRVQLERKPEGVADPGRIWLEVAEALAGAVPTPVRRLLQELERMRGDAERGV